MRIVLVGHGTAHPAGQQVGRRITEAVAAALPADEIVWAWADVVEPRLDAVLTAAPADVVVPIFLASGYHVRTDIPSVINSVGGRCRLTPAVGPDLVPALRDRLTEAEARHGRVDALVLGAAGSSRADAVAEVVAAADRLAELIDRPVTTGFVSAATPRVDAAVAQVRAAYGRVGLVSWLLAEGHFHDQLCAVGADLVTAPIADHPVLIETVLDRIRTA